MIFCRGYRKLLPFILFYLLPLKGISQNEKKYDTVKIVYLQVNKNDSAAYLKKGYEIFELFNKLVYSKTDAEGKIIDCVDIVCKKQHLKYLSIDNCEIDNLFCSIVFKW